MYPRWLWRASALPGTVWLFLLFLVPLYAVVAIAFGDVSPIFQLPVPVWNPLDWHFEHMSQVLTLFAPSHELWLVFVRTLIYVVAALALSVLIGYPVAYYIARFSHRSRTTLIVLLLVPFLVSYMLRMLSWVNLLAPDGYVNSVLTGLGILRTPYDWLGGHGFVVVLGLVYGYVPYLILPLYATLDRIDQRHLEAARDLGASRFSTFIHVTLPLSKTGLLGGAAIIALPMFGDYYTTNILSGTPDTSMLGNQIDFYFHGGPQPTVGAAITVVLAAFLVVVMSYYLFSVNRAQKEMHAV
ncbi:MAG TPA: ABC transporter permease [Solirubrobacteraceae bacterium]|jgi:spermidine/putrescine transport system permease protein|nr:ABC transporter permease [Solirubrobacteraceae bacterium]